MKILYIYLTGEVGQLLCVSRISNYDVDCLIISIPLGHFCLQHSVKSSCIHQPNSQSSSAPLRTIYSIIILIKTGFVLNDPIWLPGSLKGDRSSFLITWYKLICMLFIDHEKSTLCSSHPHVCQCCSHTHTHTQIPCFFRQRSLRHGLVYGLNAVSHGKLIHDFLMHLFKVHLPCIVSLSTWNFDHTASLDISREVKDVLWGKMLNEPTSTPLKVNVKTIPAAVAACTRYLMKARVLHVVRRSLLLSFNLYTNLKANGTWHRWLVCSLFCNTGNKYSATSFVWRPLETMIHHPLCSTASTDR